MVRRRKSHKVCPAVHLCRHVTVILDDAIANGRGAETFVICTQPRRISAISVAERYVKISIHYDIQRG